MHTCGETGALSPPLPVVAKHRRCVVKLLRIPCDGSCTRARARWLRLLCGGNLACCAYWNELFGLILCIVWAMTLWVEVMALMAGSSGLGGGCLWVARMLCVLFRIVAYGP